MNSSVVDFVKQNITNQRINSGSKIEIIIFIIFSLIGVGIIIFFIIYASQKLKKDEAESTGGRSAEDRINLGLEVYKNYFNMTQLKLPDNGIYITQNNKNEDEKKYYGLRDYFYASSYKSYLPCGYTDDVVSYNAIRSVILNGARVINLDLFYSGISQYLKNSEVIVGNVVDGKLTYFKEIKDQKPIKNKHYLIFENCMRIVYDLAWTKVNTPFFIYLNMEFLPDQNFENKMFNIIRKVLASRFLDKYYGFQRINLGNIPVGKAMNKVILMTNRKPLDPMLNEIINGVMAPVESNVILHTITNNSLQYGGIKTVAINYNQTILNQSMYNLVAVIKKNDTNPENEKIMKIDTKNYDTSYNFELGISMTFMNWQNYEAPKEEPANSTTPAPAPEPAKKDAPKNDFMYEYLLRFKDKGGMILKPKELIPKPPSFPIVLKPNPKVDYKQVSYKSFGSFQTTTL